MLKTFSIVLAGVLFCTINSTVYSDVYSDELKLSLYGEVYLYNENGGTPIVAEGYDIYLVKLKDGKPDVVIGPNKSDTKGRFGFFNFPNDESLRDYYLVIYANKTKQWEQKLEANNLVPLVGQDAFYVQPIVIKKVASP